MTSIELLSPARNLECGIAAIDHGADAVYLGAERFGARAAAGNSVEDIETLCKYAHQYGARVYVTVNTLLYDDELEATRELVWRLYRVGVDALIVQDVALLKMDLPPIELHASTQMDNRSPEKARWLQSMGFGQMVLARELSLDEIRAIHQEVPDMPLEAFVHGALCVSYSGRCNASQYCFRRSANRGECAQFCRLRFSLTDADGNFILRDRYLLSLKDMNRTESLEEMMDAGVRSFKIEGRLKDVSYVKNVTAWYRKHIDAILKRRPEYVRASLGHETYTFEPDPSRSFSRGFTSYFLKGRTPDITSWDTPKSIGQMVGVVKDVRRDCIVVASTSSFANGDGFCYLDAQGTLCGFRASRVEGNHLYPDRMPQIATRTPLYRNQDQQWERILNRPSAERRIHASWRMEEIADGFTLTFYREDGYVCSKSFVYEHQLARTDQSEGIRQQLSRMGDTVYEITAVEIAFSQPWFIPRSQLATWRRMVMQEVEEPQRVQRVVRGEDTVSMPDSVLVANGMSRDFCKEQGVKDEIALEIQKTQRQDILLMTCRHCIRFQLGCCPTHHKVRSPYPEPWYLQSQDGRKFRLHFDCRHCQMEVLSV